MARTRFTRSFLILAAGALLSLPGGVLAQAQPQVLQRTVLSTGAGMVGADRTYSYYIPSTADRHGFNPIVFALRDNGETVEQFAQQSGWLKLADENGFIVVFPEPAGGKDWSPYSGDENAYLKSVYDHVSTHLRSNDGGPAPQAQQAPPPAPAAAAPGIAGDEPVGAFRRPPSNRINTWQPWQYMTGEGAGAVAAQEFTMNNPGLIAAVATLDGKAYPAAYTRSAEVAQGYFEDQRGGKTAIPVWRPQKKDVPVAAWLFTKGAPTSDEAKLEAYWKGADAVAAAPATRTLGAFQTLLYAAPAYTAQQVLTSVVAPDARYDYAMTSAIWDSLFSRVARWTSSPNGELGTMLPQPEVNKEFEVKETKVKDLTYKYYVKTPSSYRKGQSLPLVISLHGGEFPAWMYLSQIKMHEVGEREGFITAYLNGQGDMWNFTIPDSPDMQAIQNLIDEVAAEYHIDRSRIYLQGFSFGSGLAHVEGLVRPQLFAAISPDSGIGDFTQPVLAAINQMKAQHPDVRMPTLVVYGAVDAGGSTDGKIPGQGVLRNAFDFLKSYDHIDTQDRTEVFNSSNTDPYEILIPGGKESVIGVNAQYPDGRIHRYDYLSTSPKGLPLFSFMWVTDMPHGSNPGQAQMIWDYFKHWKRSPDGSLSYSAQ